ncbi:unnamed protein product [Schistocephalus solidus]|uniref:C2H2-type domain-containing protein n=1 Tax=Schistocephalus solidus TaxID=70667 RepID=A0A183TIF3_SCHSO|nr:unnamed protein product [Schistocephalus solidus]
MNSLRSCHFYRHFHPTSINDLLPASPDFSCQHCARNFNSCIGLVGHLRIHRTEAGEPLQSSGHISNWWQRCPFHIGDDLVGKLIKELQKLGVSQYSVPPPEKITCYADFARWEARGKDYLEGVDTRAQIGTILALLDDEALALAREEEVLKAACEKSPRSLFGVTAVQPHSSSNAFPQTPWQPYSCGSSPHRNNWRRPQTRRLLRPKARRIIQAIDLHPGPSDGFYTTGMGCWDLTCVRGYAEKERKTKIPLVREVLVSCSRSVIKDGFVLNVCASDELWYTDLIDPPMMYELAGSTKADLSNGQFRDLEPSARHRSPT